MFLPLEHEPIDRASSKQGLKTWVVVAHTRNSPGWWGRQGMDLFDLQCAEVRGTRAANAILVVLQQAVLLIRSRTSFSVAIYLFIFWDPTGVNRRISINAYY